MTIDEVMHQLSGLGEESVRKIYRRHGARDPFFGVKVGDLKIIQKRIRKNHELALSLYDSGNSDAMYLAGLISEPKKMNRQLLDKWANDATWYMLSEYTVAWVAAESGIGFETALDWIESDRESVASAGWATLSSLVSITPDGELDLAMLERLMERVVNEINSAPDRVRYTMNNFVIAVGGFVAPLLEKSKAAAVAIGRVSVDMGGTACKVPLALEYIEKIERSGRVGKKKKTVFC